MRTGAHGLYEWLEVAHDLGEFLSLCPGAIVGRYLAISARDSGFFEPSEQDRAAGWNASGGVAYSPRVDSIATLPPYCYGQCAGYDEWYIFQSQPPPLGSIRHENVFTSEIGPGNVFQFVNFMGCPFSDSQVKPIGHLFWRQMDWVQPESYVADGGDCLLFATRNSALYGAVGDMLSKQPTKHSDPESTSGES
jgi:hypothetical protein